MYLLSALARNVSLYLVACNLYLSLSVAVYSLVCLSLFAFRNLTKIPFIPRSTISVCLMFFRDSVLVLVFLFFGFWFLFFAVFVVAVSSIVLKQTILPVAALFTFLRSTIQTTYVSARMSSHCTCAYLHRVFFEIESNRDKQSAKRTEKQ